MKLRWEKWHGCGNDFVVIYDPCVLSSTSSHTSNHTNDDLITGDRLRSSLIKNAPDLCVKDGSSIGADGILLVSRTHRENTAGLWALTIINADGSCARNCGNGLRVVTLSLMLHYDRKELYCSLSECLDVTGNIRIFWNVYTTAYDQAQEEDIERLNSSVLQNLQHPYSQGWAEVDMSQSSYNVCTHIFRSLQEQLEGSDLYGMYDLQSDAISAVNLRNHHLVLQSSRIEAIALKNIAQCLLSKDHSVLWNIHAYCVKPISHEESDEAQRYDYFQSSLSVIEDFSIALHMIPWERGVGLTKACGSGACAVALDYVQKKICFDDKTKQILQKVWLIPVNMPGGRVWVKIMQDAMHFKNYLIGPAVHIYDASSMVDDK